MSELATFTIENHKRASLIKIAGRVDSSNASQLDSLLITTLDEGQKNLVIELSELEYLSSAGLRYLVGTLKECRKRGGDLRIASPSERVDEVLRMAGLKALFATYGDTTAAIGSF